MGTVLEPLEPVRQPVPVQDRAEEGPIDVRLFHEPDDALLVLRPSGLEGDGGQVLGFQDLTALPSRL